MEIMQRNGRRVSTKVDLTAMVDLGFLLITFFMLATTMADPASMQLIMPAADGDPSEYPQSKTLTLLIGPKDKVYAYTLPDQMDSASAISIDSVDYSSNGVRKIIQQRQKEVALRWGNRDQLFVLIKPMPGSRYKHTIDVLDEMMINHVKRYTILRADASVDTMVMNLIGVRLKNK